MSDASPQHNHSRSTSVPEELSDDDLPTATPSPAHGSSGHLASEALLRLTSNEAKAHIEHGDENIVCDQGSGFHRDQEEEASSRLEEQHLLKLENFQEELFTSKHVTCSTREEHQYSPSEARERSEVEDIKKAPHESQSPAENKTLFSNLPTSLEPAALSSKMEAPIKDPEASTLADGYHDDFETSLVSSPVEKHHSFSDNSISQNKLEDPIKDFPIRAIPYDSQDEEIEEEIAEELSHNSGLSERSRQSERLLDLHKQTEDSNHDKSINSAHSPPVCPLHIPKSPVIDEMPTFNIGDRVLVGGVQPGTLRFKGPTSFANGYWAGVELDKSEGSNNGTYDGVVYFSCDESHGIFAPPDKITHLPDKFEMYTDTTEDEDSFFDDLSGKGGDKRKTKDESQTKGNITSKKEETSENNSGNKNVSDDSVHKRQALLKVDLNSQHYKESILQISNGNNRDIVLDFEDLPNTNFITDIEIDLGKTNQKMTTQVEEDSQNQSTQLTAIISDDKGEPKDTDLMDRFADNLFNSFVKDTMKQFAEIKKAKEHKITAASQMNGELIGLNVEEEWLTSVEQKDGLPFFLQSEKEELSSPELCNRPVSVYFLLPTVMC